MKKKDKTMIILQGANNKSAFMIYRNEELVPEESYHIEKYTVMYWSGNEDGLPMVATEETEHKIAISLKGSRKVEYSGRDFTLKPDFGSNHSGITFQ